MYGKSSASSLSLVSIPNEMKEKGRDLTQSCDKSPYVYRTKKQRDTIKTLPKTSITQRMRTDLGRSVGVQ